MAENIQLLMNGFATILSFQNLFACICGSILGIVIGALPGIGSLAGVSLLLPLTFSFDPVTGITLLGSIYYANMFGGAFSSILLNIPGDGPAIMTALDGYPMAKKGKAGRALFASNLSSFIGGMIGMVILALVGPMLANVGLKFGPVEMSALMMVAMTSISWLTGESLKKGLVSTMIGFVVITIGMDAMTGFPRYNFGSYYLMGGVTFTPFAIGLFGFSQVLMMLEDRKKIERQEFVTQKLTLRESLLTKSDLRRLLPPAIRSGFLGTLIGVLPGSGATASAFLCYGVQKAFKNEEPLGTGAIEGIAASEAANNAAVAGAFAPTLSLGIPGSASTAVLLGGLMAWGLKPGPLLFSNSPDFAWSTIASLFVANIVTIFIAMGSIPFLIQILSVPIKYMIPSVTVVCFVGSYAVNYSMYGVLVMLCAGFIGYICNKNAYPTAPILLSVVLGPMLEMDLRKALVISNGSPMIFFTRPISCALMIVFIAILFFPLIKKCWDSLRLS
ncbi:hypothetical protein FACS1894204_10060 [Synergistales bacterium]|nr:hypothetical protein FACS1894204_10060 [Synergistales bacterium]